MQKLSWVTVSKWRRREAEGLEGDQEGEVTGESERRGSEDNSHHSGHLSLGLGWARDQAERARRESEVGN